MKQKFLVPNELRPYHEIRDVVHTGAFVFYNGRESRFSSIIRTFTGVPPHVGVIRRTPKNDEGLDAVLVIESTTMNSVTGQRGVQQSRLSESIFYHKGDVWLGILHPWLREEYDYDAAEKYCISIEGKPYDFIQAITSGVRHYLGIIPSRSFKNQIYCSELAAGMTGAALPRLAKRRFWRQTPSPNQLVREFPIFEKFIQVKVYDKPLPLISSWLSKEYYDQITSPTV